jgi:FMN-dependent dehydrogenase
LSCSPTQSALDAPSCSPILRSSRALRRLGDLRFCRDWLVEHGDGLGEMIQRLLADDDQSLGHGAKAVCIGRPYLWGLGAFGQPGVERVLEILRAETRTAMQQVGAPSIKHLTPAMVQRA